MAAILRTEQGRRFLFRILQDCGLDPLAMQSPFTGHSLSTSLRIGMRQIGENLAMAAKRVSLENYQLAEREHLAEVERRRHDRQQ